MNLRALLPSKPIYVCDSCDIKDGCSRRVEVLYRGQIDSILLFRHKGEIKAVRNRCVHMPRNLDHVSDDVIDRTGQLRCSIHGVVFSSETCQSLSNSCRGKKLTPIKIEQIQERIYITDKRISQN